MPDRQSARQPALTSPRKKQAIIAAIVVAAGLGLGLRMEHAAPGAKPAASAPGAARESFRPTRAQLAGLVVAPVQMMTFRTERLAEGNIAYDDDAMTQVFSPYTGRVTRVFAKAGDVVRKGAPLMAVAAAEFAQAESDLATAANALKTAHEQVALTATSESRQHELYLAKSGALKDWLQSKADLATAQNNLGVAEATLSAVRQRLRIMGKSDDEIDALEKTPAEHLPNSDALLLAPISGTVTQRAVGVGQYISSVAGGGANPVFTIGNLSTLWLVANVREADAPLVRVGQPIEVHVMAFPGRKFQARITWVAPGIDPGTHRLPVRAEVENPDGALKAMMFASFTIITGKEATSPGVPESAIVHVGEEARAYVLLPDGTIALRQIRVGRTREDGMMEVAAGLAAGDRIVTAGTLFIDRAVTAKMGDKQ